MVRKILDYKPRGREQAEEIGGNGIVGVAVLKVKEVGRTTDNRGCLWPKGGGDDSGRGKGLRKTIGGLEDEEG